MRPMGRIGRMGPMRLKRRMGHNFGNHPNNLLILGHNLLAYSSALPSESSGVHRCCTLSIHTSMASITGSALEHLCSRISSPQALLLLRFSSSIYNVAYEAN